MPPLALISSMASRMPFSVEMPKEASEPVSEPTWPMRMVSPAGAAAAARGGGGLGGLDRLLLAGGGDDRQGGQALQHERVASAASIGRGAAAGGPRRRIKAQRRGNVEAKGDRRVDERPTGPAGDRTGRTRWARPGSEDARPALGPPGTR